MVALVAPKGHGPLLDADDRLEHRLASELVVMTVPGLHFLRVARVASEGEPDRVLDLVVLPAVLLERGPQLQSPALRLRQYDVGVASRVHYDLRAVGLALAESEVRVEDGPPVARQGFPGGSAQRDGRLRVNIQLTLEVGEEPHGYEITLFAWRVVGHEEPVLNLQRRCACSQREAQGDLSYYLDLVVCVMLGFGVAGLDQVGGHVGL